MHVTSLCELSKRQVPAYLTRSSDATAAKIGEIFCATMRAIVGGKDAYIAVLPDPFCGTALHRLVTSASRPSSLALYASSTVNGAKTSFVVREATVLKALGRSRVPRCHTET